LHYYNIIIILNKLIYLLKRANRCSNTRITLESLIEEINCNFACLYMLKPSASWTLCLLQNVLSLENFMEKMLISLSVLILSFLSLLCHFAATILPSFVLAITLLPLLAPGQVLFNGWMELFLCLPCSNVGSREKPWPLHWWSLHRYLHCENIN